MSQIQQRNTKSTVIYRELKQQVLSYKPGVKLPSENALAARYKVARMTVSKIFRKLEDEGILERRRGSGSYVKGVRVIHMLVPSADFLNMEDGSFPKHRELFSGVMRAAADLGAEIKLIAVSQTNDHNNIDLGSLDSISENSLVLMNGSWFFKCFSLLAARRARCAVIDTQSRCYGAAKYLANWFNLQADRVGALRTLLQKLHDAGCRRPAIASPYLRTSNIPKNDIHRAEILGEIARNLIRIKLPSGMVDVALSPRGGFPGKMIHSRSVIRQVLHKYYRKYKFDALILDWDFVLFGKDINEYCNLPPEVRICIMHFMSENVVLQEPPCNCRAAYERMGYDAVKMLLTSARSSGRKLYEYEIDNLEKLG